jgi:probable F420-dependent oxidoreductase
MIRSMDFGRLGVWAASHEIGEENGAEAARAAEAAGYGTFWLGGSPRLPALRPLLEASERLLIGTSVLNLWSYQPLELAAEFGELERAFPGRVVVGIGVGHPEADSDYRRPLAALQKFLDGLDAAAVPVPSSRRVIAALGPRMLATAAQRSLGSIPYFISVEHTRFARARLGPDALLMPELAFVLDEDVERARSTARSFASVYLGLTNYTKALLDNGFEQADLEDGGSDRLIDHVVPHGSAEDIASSVRAHLAAGADHVALQARGAAGVPTEDWSRLAAALG